MLANQTSSATKRITYELYLLLERQQVTHRLVMMEGDFPMEYTTRIAEVGDGGVAEPTSNIIDKSYQEVKIKDIGANQDTLQGSIHYSGVDTVAQRIGPG